MNLKTTYFLNSILERSNIFVTKIISGEYAIFEAHHVCRESNAYFSSIVNTCICHCLNGYIAIGRHRLKGKNCIEKYFNKSVKSCYWVGNNLWIFHPWFRLASKCHSGQCLCSRSILYIVYFLWSLERWLLYMSAGIQIDLRQMFSWYTLSFLLTCTSLILGV